MTKTTLFKSNRTQAVRLPKDVAFPDTVSEVEIMRQGNLRIIAPAGDIWGDFFDAPGLDLGDREQPASQVREMM